MTVPPALSATEWNGVLLQEDGLAHLREEFGKLPFSMHAIAAPLLYDQPFGFTRQDVQDEDEVSDYCAAMATQHHEAGDHVTAAKFELLGGRHKERAAKLAALLPPAQNLGRLSSLSWGSSGPRAIRQCPLRPAGGSTRRCSPCSDKEDDGYGSTTSFASSGLGEQETCGGFARSSLSPNVSFGGNMIRHLSSTLVRRTAVASLLAAVVAPQCAAQARAPAGRISVQWLGHAAFEIISPGGTRLLIDPFLTTNPTTPDSLKNLARYSGATKPDAILVTHSHDDHMHDAKAIAQRSGARVISVYDWINTLGLPASQVSGGNVGGGFPVGDVTVRLVPAIHSSEPGGRPIGFIIDFADGRSLYHTGDTWVFGDMSWIQELRHPNIILVCAGGVFTMDPRVALLAINRYFKPQTIIPMHYGTFPGLATPAEVRARMAGDPRVAIMVPGQKLTF